MPQLFLRNGKDKAMIYNSDQIKEIIPHRYPMLLVDQIIEINNTKIVGLKAVSVNEPFFSGHFPAKAVMPGALIVEACAQVGAVLLLSKEENKGKLAYFAGINKVRFKRQVIPGNTLRMEVELTSLKMNIGIASIKVSCEDNVVCFGEIMFGIGS